MSLIRVRKIVKSYDKLRIFNGIDFNIEKGLSYSITGKSGSGKSTLLHILALLDKADNGSYYLEDKEITDSDYKNDKYLSNIRNRRFGFVFQDNFLINDYSALENVMVPAIIRGNKRDEAYKKALKLLCSLYLEERVDHKSGELSTGERQRVAICRALMNDPDVIFADEPTGSLDEENSLYVQEMLLEIVKEYGKTLVLVTHDMDFAVKCDKVFRISNHEVGEVNR